MIPIPGTIGFDDGLPAVMTTAMIAKLLAVTQRAVQKWRKHGVSVGGHRVFLNAAFAGRQLRVAREDYYEFLRACNRETWRCVAQEQDAERKQASRDHERL